MFIYMNMSSIMMSSRRGCCLTDCGLTPPKSDYAYIILETSKDVQTCVREA